MMRRYTLTEFVKRSQENYLRSKYGTIYKAIFDKKSKRWILTCPSQPKGQWAIAVQDIPEGNRILEFILKNNLERITKVEAFIALI